MASITKTKLDSIDTKLERIITDLRNLTTGDYRVRDEAIIKRLREARLCANEAQNHVSDARAERFGVR